MLNPGLRNSGHWKMNVQNNGLSRWAREEALGETMMSPDQWVLNKEHEKTKGIVMEIRGWRRHFVQSRQGQLMLEFVPANRPTNFFPNSDGSVSAVHIF